MKLKLYKFCHPQHLDEYVFVLSTLEPNLIRQFVDIWDHGGMSYDIFVECFKNGTVNEITAIEQSKNRYIIPYNTDELVNCEDLGGKYLDVETDVEGFFEHYFGKEFKNGSG